MVGGVLPNNSTLMPSALLTDVTSTDENSPAQTEEQSGAPPLTDDEDDDDDEEEIYQSSDEEEDKEVESLVTDVPDNPSNKEQTNQGYKKPEPKPTFIME